MIMKKKRTIAAHLDEGSERRLETAARLMKRSRGASVQEAVDETTRRILLDWAISRHAQTLQSFSELAEETGLAVEEIMLAAGDHGRQEALEMFLTSCKTVAETQHNPEFLYLAQEAVDTLNIAGS